MEACETLSGEAAVLELINAAQIGGRLRATALHHASDAAADGCTQLLLARRADPEARNARSETPLSVARSRAKVLKTAGTQHEASYAAALRCVQYLEEAIEQRSTERLVGSETARTIMEASEREATVVFQVAKEGPATKRELAGAKYRQLWSQPSPVENSVRADGPCAEIGLETPRNCLNCQDDDAQDNAEDNADRLWEKPICELLGLLLEH